MKIAILTRTDELENKQRSFINQSYINTILRFHHTPIPIYGNGYEEEIAAFCDALILPGGYDIAPYYYHDSYNSSLHLYDDPTQDIRDFKILDAFIHQQKPILGICRGIQLINVYFGGTLINMNEQQHAKDHEHTLTIAPDTFLSCCMPSVCKINSYHHQCVKKLGSDIIPCAYAYDKTIEAIAHNTLPILGVQWHPELMDNDLIFSYFFHLLT